MTKSIKKATVRGEGVRTCPFGLPITEACKNAGKSVDRMSPLTQEDKEKVSYANRIVYAYHKDNTICKYADKILDNYKKVDCDFGDTAEGFHSTNFRGSPLYPQTFHGIGLDGLYGFPLGFYADNQESRNLFLGLFSLLGYTSIEKIVKLADDYDKNGDLEKSKILDSLLDKLAELKKHNKEIFDELSRNFKEKENVTPILFSDLINKWRGL